MKTILIGAIPLLGLQAKHCIILLEKKSQIS